MAMITKTLNINVGPLSSFNSLNLYLAPGLKRLRQDYVNGRQTLPVWDLRNISPGAVNLSALVAFLSISKRIRDFIGSPIPLLTLWKPEFQGFLADIGFIQIAKDFDLYDWQGMLGGFTRGRTNPSTRIFYYSDLPVGLNNHEEIVQWKDFKRQSIKHSMMLRLSNIFESKYVDSRWSRNLESVLTITGAELIVNSLLHGNDIAFVGVQRSSKRITTTICDSGLGFPTSMRKNHAWIRTKEDLTHVQAIFLASLLSKNKIGLYRAIDDVLNTNGYVIISSFNSEIRWEDKIWTLAKAKLEQIGLENISIRELGTPIEGYVETGRVYDGYYKIYDNFLIGSRVTFEIPF